MRQSLDCTKLTQYVYSERAIFSVVFRVVNGRGDVYSQGFEALGFSAVEAYSDALNQLNRLNQRETCQLLKLESMEYLETVSKRVTELAKSNWD